MKTGSLLFLAAVGIMNLAAFLLMLHDKRNAVRKKRRIPEKTLFLAAGIFGAFGGTLAMFAFRHKTKHWYFRLLFPLMMILQACIIGWLYGTGIL